jgi:hypothetical protein
MKVEQCAAHKVRHFADPRDFVKETRLGLASRVSPLITGEEIPTVTGAQKPDSARKREPGISFWPFGAVSNLGRTAIGPETPAFVLTGVSFTPPSKWPPTLLRGKLLLGIDD